MTTPYTYCITHKPSGKRYYGSRYAKNCKPEDLWVIYFTSSKTVAQLISSDGKEAFDLEIRKTFEDAKKCVDWESKVLRRLKVLTNHNWLNLGQNRVPTTEEKRLAVQKKYGVDNIFQLEETKAKIRATNLIKYGDECARRSPEIAEKSVNTCMLRYGFNTPSKSEEVQAKTRKTTLERHGNEHYLATEEAQVKAKITYRLKYNVEHPMLDEGVRDKLRATNFERYGVFSVLSSPHIKDKIKATNLEKYGFENALSSPEIKAKIKATNLVRYGVEYPSQIPSVRAKVEATCLLKYGFKSPAQSKVVQDKIRQTSLDRYGVVSYTQTDECKEKAKETNIARYGCDYYNQLESSRLAQSLRMLKHKVVCLELGTIYPSAKQAAIELFGYDTNTINNNCRTRNHETVGGYHFVYLDEFVDPFTSEDIKRELESRITPIPTSWRSVIRLEDGKVYVSTSEAAREFDGHGSNIIEVCAGARNTAYGYKWAYTDSVIDEEHRLELLLKTKDAPVQKYIMCAETKEIFVGTVQATVWLKSIGYNCAGSTALANCANGKLETAYEYRWVWVDSADISYTDKEYIVSKLSLPDFIRPVICLETGQKFRTNREITEFIRTIRPKARADLVRRCCKGEHKIAYGYHWKYLDETP